MTRKLLLLLLALLFSLAMFAGCSNGGNANQTTEAPTEAPTQPPVETLAIGETLVLENWELTVDDIEFLNELRSGMMVFSPDNDDQIFAYVSVTITNRTEERRMMFPSVLQTPRQLIPYLRYDGGGRRRRVQVRGYGRDATDRPTNAGSTTDARLIFQVDAAMGTSAQPLELEIRTNAGETVGMFELR